MQETLHGGAIRRAVRWLRPDPERPVTVSWYTIRPGGRCTRHVHTGKAETWLLVAGRGIATIGEERIAMAPGDLVTTPPGVPHALDNAGEGDVVFVNVVQPEGGPVTTTELEP